MSYCPSIVEFRCYCLRMESIGMPYGHIVIVLQALDLNELPKSLRLDRWSKEAREEIRCIFVGACNYWYSYLVARYATILDLSR